jgi:hypothetical protein
MPSSQLGSRGIPHDPGLAPMVLTATVTKSLEKLVRLKVQIFWDIISMLFEDAMAKWHAAAPVAGRSHGQPGLRVVPGHDDARCRLRTTINISGKATTNHMQPGALA